MKKIIKKTIYHITYTIFLHTTFSMESSPIKENLVTIIYQKKDNEEKTRTLQVESIIDIASCNYNIKHVRRIKEHISFELQPKPPFSWELLAEETAKIKTILKKQEPSCCYAIVLDTSENSEYNTLSKNSCNLIPQFEKNYFSIMKPFPKDKNKQCEHHEYYIPEEPITIKVKGLVSASEDEFYQECAKTNPITLFEGTLKKILNEQLALNPSSTLFCAICETIMDGFKAGRKVRVKCKDKLITLDKKYFMSSTDEEYYVWTNRIETIYNSPYQSLYGNKESPYFHALKPAEEKHHISVNLRQEGCFPRKIIHIETEEEITFHYFLDSK